MTRMRSSQSAIVSRRGVKMWLLPVALALVACGDGATVPAPSAHPDGISAVAESYLTTVLDTMETHSINRFEIDWPSFREATFDVAGAARTTRDTYDAIRDAVRRLGDMHSRFLEPEQASASRFASSAIPPPGRRINPRVGYVEMPSFSSLGRPASEIVEHAEQYHDLLGAIDSTTVCGWVVDLRLNGGGNMWPMLAGIEPLVGEGTVGFFVEPDSTRRTWFYRNGAAGIEDVGVITAVGNEVELAEPAPAVAVLTRSETASSGEAIVTAFRGRPVTRSFGEGTRGLSTANRGFFLSDGALLLLTVSAFADRTGRVYGGVIAPDSLIFGSRTGMVATDAALAAAVAWVEGRPVCGA